MEANVFLDEITPIFMGGNNENDRVTSPLNENLFLYIRMCRFSWKIIFMSVSAGSFGVCIGQIYIEQSPRETGSDKLSRTAPFRSSKMA